MNGETEYLKILERILTHGERKENRTGIDTFAIPPCTITHDMSEGFPLLTTKNVAFKPIRTELEFFIKGLTDKKWLQERGNHIWDEWASPWEVKEALLADPNYNAIGDIDWVHDEMRIDKQKEVTSLGPIYGKQWRDFNGGAVPESSIVNDGSNDQLQTIVNNLHNNPNDRRMVCSAWNPLQLSEMALPPCHLLWNVNHINGTLHLHWHQRSVDCGLGLPFNLASYALLLHLLCEETGFKAGQLSGTLMDCHIYENHVDQVREQLHRTPYELPKIETTGFTNIFDWQHTMTKSVGYKHHPTIKMEVAV
jgi:thymidylate synthase